MFANAESRFESVEVTIPTLSHDYYLGKDSGATHFWHGETKGIYYYSFKCFYGQATKTF